MSGTPTARDIVGVTGRLPYDPVQYCVLAAGTAIAWAYTIELDLLVVYTFRRRKGLYFWSLLIGSWGCTLHALGFILKFLVGTSWLVDLPFIEIGWVAMINGQALVLYSRLHLVVRSRRTLRMILYMIIFDALVLQVPTIVFTYGSNSPDSAFWVNKFNVMERIQLAGFCIQEFVISTVYIVATVRLLGSIYHSMTKKVMSQLLLINCICIGMDVVLICLEFTNNYGGEASIKPMIYAIKLKLEFAVLNQLMALTKAGFTADNQWRGDDNPNSHELRSRNKVSATDPEATPARSPRIWNAAKSVKNPFSARTSIACPDQIYQTQQVEITSEPKSKLLSDFSVSTTAVTVGELPPKAQILTGRSTMHMPARPSRPKRPDPSDREPSRSDSEKQIFRKSEDSEKEGTRWIAGIAS